MRPNAARRTRTKNKGDSIKTSTTILIALLFMSIPRAAHAVDRDDQASVVQTYTYSYSPAPSTSVTPSHVKIFWIAFGNERHAEDTINKWLAGIAKEGMIVDKTDIVPLNSGEVLMIYQYEHVPVPITVPAPPPTVEPAPRKERALDPAKTA